MTASKRIANSITRRRFLKSTAALSAIAALPAMSWARVRGANDRINMAVIGTGGMGHAHLRDMNKRRDKDNINVFLA